MIDFSNASVLGYNVESKFLGDSNFRIGVTKNVTVEGFIDNLLNVNGVSGTLYGVQNFLNLANDWHDIIIKGINYGKGRVNSISFNEGNWVKFTNYTAEIVILESGTIYNMTGEYYSGLYDAFSNPANNLNLLDSISENFDFDVDQDGKWSSERTISIKFLSGDSNNPITRAKSLAYSFFNNPISFGFINSQYSGYYRTGTKKYYTERYNQIDFSCDFTESFSIDQNSGNYSVTRYNTIDTDDLGVTTVSENATIKGIVSPTYNSALSGLNQEFALSYARCNEVFSFYKPAGADDLSTQFIEKGTNLNEFEGIVGYNVTYTNDSRFASGYYWEYTHSVSLDQDQFYTVTENGTIVGFGKLGSPEKINRARLGYNAVEAGINGRCNSVYSKYGSPVNLRFIAESYEESPYRGQVQYSQSFCDDTSYINDSVIKKVDVNIKKQKPSHIFETYTIPNFKQIVQVGGQTNLSQDSLSIDLLIKPEVTMTAGNINYCLNYCLTILAQVKSNVIGVDAFVTDVSYEVDELEKRFRFQGTVNHIYAISATDINLKWP